MQQAVQRQQQQQGGRKKEEQYAEKLQLWVHVVTGLLVPPASGVAWLHPASNSELPAAAAAAAGGGGGGEMNSSLPSSCSSTEAPEFHSASQ